MSDEQNSPKHSSNVEKDVDTFRLMVKDRAYFKAEQRGFAYGHELDDWLEAEQEIRNECLGSDEDTDSS